VAFPTEEAPVPTAMFVTNTTDGAFSLNTLIVFSSSGRSVAASGAAKAKSEASAMEKAVVVRGMHRRDNPHSNASPNATAHFQ